MIVRTQHRTQAIQPINIDGNKIRDVQKDITGCIH